MDRLTWAVSIMKKCYVAPSTIDKSLNKDDLQFDIAMTTIMNYIKDGVITGEEIEKRIKE